MVVTIDCRDTINCKVTIVLCNGAQLIFAKIALCGSYGTDLMSRCSI